MFTDFFYLLRARGLDVSMNEWLSLMEALKLGLCRNSLLEFYYVARGILVKTEADFDKFDETFLTYFEHVQHMEDIPQELIISSRTQTWHNIRVTPLCLQNCCRAP